MLESYGFHIQGNDLVYELGFGAMDFIGQLVAGCLHNEWYPDKVGNNIGYFVYGF